MTNPATHRKPATSTLLGIVVALLLVAAAGCTETTPDTEQTVSPGNLRKEYLHTYVAFSTNGLAEQVGESGTTVDISGTDMVLPGPDTVVAVTDRTLGPTNAAGFAAFLIWHNHSPLEPGTWIKLSNEERCVVFTIYHSRPVEKLLDLLATECLDPPG